ncbi:HNH endonuclease [Paenibacillus elgii]|uniref:HNH endonuclease n=1 Tax=Paenibacillus elgii TaxID=189691 RepID=UPI000248E086
MPQKLKKPCSYPGCRTLTHDRFCPDHQKQHRQQQDSRRGSAHERGYNARWRRYREQYLRRHPLCVECLERGVLTAAMVVDHIIAHRGDYALFWSPDNHQSLCENDHNRKTVREDGGFGNRRKLAGKDAHFTIIDEYATSEFRERQGERHNGPKK